MSNPSQPSSPDPGSESWSWAQLLVDTFLGCGVRHFVVSPGSRSTPLVAAVELALRADAGIERTLVIDERSAGFFALGRAKLTGNPSVLVCTSGSAPAHYYPAVIEADQSQVPLIVVSANRPPELQGNCSSQTIDQTHLFGTRVRGYLDLGVAERGADARLGLARKVKQAVALATGARRGPVHIDMPARKPLQPASLEQFLAQASPPVAPLSPPHLVGKRKLQADQVRDLAALASGAERSVLSLGPSAPPHALDPKLVNEFLRRTGWVLFAEATTQVRLADVDLPRQQVWDEADWMLRALAQEPEGAPDVLPDFILHVGPPPTSGAWQRLMGNVRHVIISEGMWADASNRALSVVDADPAGTLLALMGHLPRAGASWSAQLHRYNQLAASAREEVLARTAFNELHAVAALGRSLRSGDLLCVGNSLPVRLLDLSVPYSTKRVSVLSQRGASGIDGLVASALGAATAHYARDPTAGCWLLLGDVSLLHDSGSLQLVRDAQVPLQIVVLNNRGGRIFEQLPIARFASPLLANRAAPAGDAASGLGLSLDSWLTPHDISLATIASGFGVNALVVDSEAEFVECVTDAKALQRPRCIEVRVPEHGAEACQRAVIGCLGAEWKPKP